MFEALECPLQVYGVFLFTTQFTLPMLVTTAAYSLIISKLATRGGVTGSQGAGAGRNTVRVDISKYLPYLHYLRDQVRRRAERARDRRRSRLLLAVLAGFVVCWLPLNLINIAEDFSYNVHCWRWYLVLSIT